MQIVPNNKTKMWSGVEWSGVEWSGVEWCEFSFPKNSNRNLILNRSATSKISNNLHHYAFAFVIWNCVLFCLLIFFHIFVLFHVFLWPGTGGSPSLAPLKLLRTRTSQLYLSRTEILPRMLMTMRNWFKCWFVLRACKCTLTQRVSITTLGDQCAVLIR